MTLLLQLQHHWMLLTTKMRSVSSALPLSACSEFKRVRRTLLSNSSSMPVSLLACSGKEQHNNNDKFVMRSISNLKIYLFTLVYGVIA